MRPYIVVDGVAFLYTFVRGETMINALIWAGFDFDTAIMLAEALD